MFQEIGDMIDGIAAIIITLVIVIALFIGSVGYSTYAYIQINKLKTELTETNIDLGKQLNNIYYLRADVSYMERIIGDIFNRPFNVKQTVYTKTVTATAYTAREEECNGEPEMTASGRPSRVGAIAVSRDLEALGVNLGDLVIIKGMGSFIVTRVEDRTGEFKRKNTDEPVLLTNTIDILHANVKAAKIFGIGPEEIIWLGNP